MGDRDTAAAAEPTATAWVPLFGVAAVVATALVATSAGYGYHRDELYFLEAGRIFDLAGRHPLAACRGALTRTGTLVVASGHGGPVFGPLGRYVRAHAWSPFVTQRLRVHATKPSRSDLDAITALIEAGAVTPAIEATYELADTADAIRHLAEEHARAKIVISMRDRHAASQPDDAGLGRNVYASGSD